MGYAKNEFIDYYGSGCVNEEDKMKANLMRLVRQYKANVGDGVSMYQILKLGMKAGLKFSDDEIGEFII